MVSNVQLCRTAYWSDCKRDLQLFHLILQCSVALYDQVDDLSKEGKFPLPKNCMFLCTKRSAFTPRFQAEILIISINYMLFYAKVLWHSVMNIYEGEQRLRLFLIPCKFARTQLLI